jgi:saccharopine dehydrogenase-like NADP-dependent oxidoreductase
MHEVTVAVLGAGGTIAPALVRDLAESEEVAGLELMDLDADRARAVADEHGLGKARARAVDARAGLGDVLERYDVLVNAASYRVNVDAMRACLWGGCQYSTSAASTGRPASSSSSTSSSSAPGCSPCWEWGRAPARPT